MDIKYSYDNIIPSHFPWIRIMAHVTYVHFCWAIIASLSDMPRNHKRKRDGAIAESTAASTAPTLKEFIWKEMNDIIRLSATESLSGKEFSSLAMKRFR